MASAGAEPTPALPAEWNALELAVRRLLEQHDAIRRKAEQAEQRTQELEAALGAVSAGNLDPVALSARADALTQENRLLADRLAEANALVERIVARLNYLEAER